MKRITIILLSILVIMVLAGSTDSPDTELFYELMIYEDHSIEDIAVELKSASIIKNKKAFIVYGKIFGKYNEIKPGIHEISTDMKFKEMFKELRTYKELEKEKVKVVIPEGFNVRQIAKRLEEKGVVRESDFSNAINNEEFNYWFLEDIPVVEDKNYYRLEGFLFPATYEFYTNSNPIDIINTMLKRFDYAISPYKEEIKNSDKNIFDIIRMASVVERESRLHDEMEIISGVFYNRLDIGMKLQSCATVQYLFEEQKSVVTYEDLKIESPFNTYRNEGLPVGAISNPGDNAIKASIYPQENEYLYFVAIGSTGQHKFAKTFEEHEENIRKYRD